jgi:periplasmic protein TonB
MFNNLIESSSHQEEMKRRGSFLLFTTITYAVLFAIAGVASIYAYDARLNEQSTELTMLTFAPVQPELAQPPSPPRGPSSESENSNVTQPVRPILFDSVHNPTNAPRDIGVTAPTVPPAPPNAVLGPVSLDPPGNGRPGGDGVVNSSNSNMVRVLNDAGTPPPAPKPAPPRVIRTSKVLNSQALYLPKPQYPPIAKQVGAQGMVSVQVLIDEQGKVISAKVLSGNPMLAHAAQESAYQARFSPTIIGENPVKVSGVITYNFVLQR